VTLEQAPQKLLQNDVSFDHQRREPAAVEICLIALSAEICHTNAHAEGPRVQPVGGLSLRSRPQSMHDVAEQFAELRGRSGALYHLGDTKY
jgi:hypothetical protein